MPKVPELNPGSISTVGFSEARLNNKIDNNTFRSGLADYRIQQQVQQVTQNISNLFEKEKEEADRSLVIAKETEARKKFGSLLRGEKDKDGNVVKPGYLDLQGLDPNAQKDNYNKEYKKFLDDQDNSFTNDYQKRLWSERKSRLDLDFYNQIENHAFDQIKKYSDEKNAESLENINEDIILNYNKDPLKVEAGLKDQEEVLNLIASSKGLDGERKATFFKEQKSGVYRAVVSDMANSGNDLLAGEYFKNIKDKLTLEDKSKVESILAESSFRGESQRASDKIIEKGLGKKESLDLARSIESPKLRDEVVKRVKDRLYENDKLLEDARRENFNSAFSLVDKDPRREAIPLEQWNKLEPKHIKIIDGWIEAKKSGKNIATDYNVYYKLRTMASTPQTQDKFLKEDLLDYRLSLSNKSFEEMVKLQDGLRRGSSEAQNAVDGFRSDKQVVDDALKQSGFDLRTTDDKEISRINEFKAEVDRRVQQEKTKSGKKYIDNVTLQGIVDSMLIEGSRGGFLGFFKEKKKAFEINPGEEFDFEVDSIPRRDRSKIESALKIKGIPINDDNIIRLYLNKNADMFK